ncbi:MAG: hypothetical protein P1V20_12140 [Verrucomicrobiales bacterium]|nr:hypothetical protein [Verrucomicrobiales bacterium]
MPDLDYYTKLYKDKSLSELLSIERALAASKDSVNSYQHQAVQNLIDENRQEQNDTQIKREKSTIRLSVIAIAISVLSFGYATLSPLIVPDESAELTDTLRELHEQNKSVL